jgi:hypothetical protein
MYNISFGSLNSLNSLNSLSSFSSNNNVDNELFNKNKCVIHLIDYTKEDDEYITADDITEYITDQHSELWFMMKQGDLIENISKSGYRSEGRYYVDIEYSQKPHIQLVRNKLIVKELYREHDTYGTLTPYFHTITQFPIHYFDDILVNIK